MPTKIRRAPTRIQKQVVENLDAMNKGLHRPVTSTSGFSVPRTREQIEEAKERTHTRTQVRGSQSKPYPEAKPGSMSKERQRRREARGVLDY